MESRGGGGVRFGVLGGVESEGMDAVFEADTKAIEGLSVDQGRSMCG